MLSLLCCCNRTSCYIVSIDFLFKILYSFPVVGVLKVEARKGSKETRKRTVDRQLAVSNNLLDLSLLLQIGKTSPREGTIDL